MGYKDLREWLDRVESLGELKHIQGAHWNLEIGTMVEMVRAHHSRPPALLFENIPDYPANARLLAGMYNTARRLALTLQLPVETDEKGLVQAWRKKVRSLAQIPPVEVNHGPILENVMTGGAVDLSIFPAPLWHKLDGGRYLGTAGPTITRDPDENWINLGNYRVMVQGKDLLSVWISPGKHGRIHRDKYFARGVPCPVAIVFGGDPLLLLSGMVALPARFSEYDFVGAVRGERIEVIQGPYTRLPIPAHAEMAIEGDILPDQKAKEGPFGEFTGYYASGAHEEYLIKVHSVLYRNDPIICGAPPSIPPTDSNYGSARLRSALVWNALEDCGVPGVQGVCCHEIGGGLHLTIVSIKQLYPGHAKQVALLATNVASGAYMGRYSIVVDEDIDPFNLKQIMWALCTRCDPETSVDLIRRCWSGPLDPIIPREQAGFNSRLIFEAVRPFEWKDKFPPVVERDPEVEQKVRTRWKELFS
jgi:UbiD family decarboxylase